MAGYGMAQVRKLADDWDRYGTLADEEWRNSMRRAVVLELEIEVARLRRAVMPIEEPRHPRWQRVVDWFIGDEPLRH